MHLDDHSLSLSGLSSPGLKYWWKAIKYIQNIWHYHFTTIPHTVYFMQLIAQEKNKKWKNRSQIKGLNSYKSNYFHTENNSKPIYILEKSEKNNHQGKTSFVFQKPAILFCGGRVFFLMIKDSNTLLTTLVGKLVT